MDTYIAYFDESGDDGSTTASSDVFVLTSIYMNSNDWQKNYDLFRTFRSYLKDSFGLHVSEEIHTKNLLTDKDPYRKYNWFPDEKRNLIIALTKYIARLSLKVINVIIDKTKFIDDTYPVLENALKYNIQRIENDCNSKWNYLIITDKGRLAPMRKTARAIRAFNPIHSKYGNSYTNIPIKNMIEDIMEKDSRESFFIQISDFISCFVRLYYEVFYLNKPIPNRAAKLINDRFIQSVMMSLKPIFNLKASAKNEFGLVIYPQ